MHNLSYRDAHVDFVSGHVGTSLCEIAVVVCSAPIGLCLRNALSGSGLKYFKDSSNRVKFQIDFITLILPVLCCFTVLSHCIGETLTFMTLFTLILIFRRRKFFYENFKHLKIKLDVKSVLNIPVTGKRQFIDAFRANVNIAAGISILAVDFVIFPRRYSKAETYGSGLMDVGVGAFVISNAIVSPESRGKYQQTSSIKRKAFVVLKSVQSSSPLWILGFIRLLAVKSTNYQEHVSEYGVHWNFFFTLACIKVLSTLVLCVFPPTLSWLLALVCAVGYQYLLSGLNVREFVLHGSDGQGSRRGLLNANREGLASCLGYLSIYFLGVQLGEYLFKPRKTIGDWVKALFTLIILDVTAWICLWFTQEYVEPISRRFANLPYVLWMVAYNLQLIPCFLFVDLVNIVIGKRNTLKDTKDKVVEVFCLLDAINYNGLLYFILANVLTGCVNLTVSTIYILPKNAFLILVGYMYILCTIVSILYVKKVKCKFW